MTEEIRELLIIFDELEDIIDTFKRDIVNEKNKIILKEEGKENDNG